MGTGSVLWNPFRRWREWRSGMRRTAPGSAGVKDPVDLSARAHPDPGPERRQRGMLVVKRGLAQAEEKYLVASDATLGTWFSRVAETITVAARIMLERIDAGRRLEEAEIAGEQLDLFADICAEAIRATSQLWGESSSSQAREEIIELIFASAPTTCGPSWVGTLKSLARSAAALEPLANGLRDGDLLMAEPTDIDRVAAAFLEVAIHAREAIDALC